MQEVGGSLAGGYRGAPYIYIYFFFFYSVQGVGGAPAGGGIGGGPIKKMG